MFFGIGIEVDQVENLFLDFFNLYLVSMYILHYRNPVLVRNMKKVFWVFPSRFDSQDKWARLDPDVVKQVKWLRNPIDIHSHLMSEIKGVILQKPKAEE